MMRDLLEMSLKGRVEHALNREARLQTFLEEFPPMPVDTLDPLPSMSWSQLERQLVKLAGPDFERVPWELEILKASARLNPPEMFLQDLLALAWSLSEEAAAFSNPGALAMD